jgi:hypothetical protein
MKVKLKLDKEALKQFFLEHMEKMLFAVVVLCSLMMLYDALTQKGFDKKPNQLIQASDGAEQHIKQTPDSYLVDLYPAPFYGQIVKDSLTGKKVDPAPYVNQIVWDPAVVKARRLRPQPELLAAIKLRGVAGRAAFMAKGGGAGRAGGSEGKQGMRYVVLTAPVPIEQQIKAYNDAFDGAAFYNPQTDSTPQYKGFYVERAEVLPSGQSQELKWEQIAVSIDAVTDALAQWQQTLPEIVDPRYIIGGGGATVRGPRGGGRSGESINALVFPLGPLVGRAWGAEVAHEPEIPLARRSQDDPREKSQVPAVDPKKPHAGGFDRDDDTTETQKPAPEVRTEEDTSGTVKYALLRFFDFKAKPGTDYRYRVRLVMHNPNYGVDPSFLANPGDARVKNLTAPWSEPSDVVVMPDDVSVLVRSVKPPRPNQPTAEPDANVTVMKWVEDTGVTAHQDFDKNLRGQVLNFGEHPIGPPPPKPPPGSLDRTHRTAAGAKAPSVDYRTDSVLVDMAGDGQSGDALLLDPSGLLVFHSDIDDNAAFKKWEDEEKKAVEQPQQGGGFRPKDRFPPGGGSLLDNAQPGRKPAPRPPAPRPPAHH